MNNIEKSQFVGTDQTNNRIKDFLLAKSQLAKFNEKEANGRSLTKQEKAKQNRIYEARDQAFRKIKDAIANYYKKAINGNYLYDGMPKIDWGIRGWAEEKAWRLLVEIGEPGHLRYKSQNQEEYWKEKE